MGVSSQRVLGTLLFAGSAATGLTPIADGDVYWHLAAGREMLRTGGFLHADPFSISAAGRPWPDVHWLFQLGLYMVHAHGGLFALVIAKCLLIGVGALGLFFAIEREARALFVPLFVFALFFARHLLLVRPVIVSLVLLALFIAVLERFRRNGGARALAILPLAQLVWCNCQGLFALGPAVIAAYAVEAFVQARFTKRISRRATNQPWVALVLTLFATSVASLATPYGTALVGLPFKLLGRLSPGAGNPFEEVAENMPPFAFDRIAPGSLGHLPWFLLAYAIGIAVSARRTRLAQLLLLCGFSVLALIANRNVLLLYWIATPILAQQLAPSLLALARRVPRLRVEPLAATLGATALLAAGHAAARETPLGAPAAFRFPIESTRVLAASHAGGGIFSADQDGGYLIWSLFPRFKPYIDTRLVLRTAAQYQEYLSIAEDPGRFDAFARREDLSYVTLPVAYPDRYLHLIAHLYRSEEWTLIFTNGSEVLFARTSGRDEPARDLGDDATIDRILAGISQRFAHSDALQNAARIQLASLVIGVGEFGQAERILGASRSLDALALRARARMLAGDLSRAQQIGEQLLHDGERDVRNLDLMAMIYASRGQYQPAAALLRRALEIDPFDGEATSLLATMEEHHDDD